ncbi:hypothetical protein FBUS_03194 [Fasciolopsis buskii]|uniref:Uncharacterized protein n=1 Tax=Fasciolopsis buskii TaxID=27845 RepID=A0A8E0S4C7_9TREM|nr:hypothetical protein FBUS_03194 [Fasciolopsis buski]
MLCYGFSFDIASMMSRILFGTVILQVLLLCSIEGLILPGYSKPRPVTKAEQAEFYSVVSEPTKQYVFCPTRSPQSSGNQE